MGELNDLQRLPVEVFDVVLELLHADSELVSLGQTCRDMNERTTPLIYSHTIIDLSPHLNLIKAADIEEDKADMDVQVSLNLMAGLANNYRQQCRYVQQLSVRNGYLKESTKGTRYGVPGRGNYFDVSSLASHSPWVWANMILGMAIPRMSLLSKLVWTAEMPPTNQIFGCVPPGQLKSLVYRFSGDFFFHLKVEWPNGFRPGVRAMKTPSLSYLMISDITSFEATEDVSSFLVDNKDTLEVLKLRFLEEFTLEDKLLNIVYPIIDLESQLRLHTLHLRNALSPGVPGWLEAFDFTSIRTLVLIESNPAGNKWSKELWNTFRRTDQRFESLATNCENDALIEFVESTQGLEQLVLSSLTKPIDSFPKLNNHFDTLKSLFLPQGAPWEVGSTTREVMDIVSNCKQLEQLCITLDYKNQEHIFAILSELPNLKHLFFDRYDSFMSVKDDLGPPLGDTAFLGRFCDFRNSNGAGSACFGRLELLSYFRSLWSMNSIGKIDDEPEDNQPEGIDGPAQHANDSKSSEIQVAGKHNRPPVLIYWDDHLDDEMILALHTWVTHSGWR